MAKSKKTLWQTIRRPPWRTLLPAFLLLILLFLGRAVWRPGHDVTNGSHDRRRNGIWLQHGWLGDDQWFAENDKTKQRIRFRSEAKLRTLAQNLRRNHITDVFPHLCPTRFAGVVMAVDDAQTERFLKAFSGFRVLPWVGGVLNVDIDPENPRRRQIFIQSVVALLRKHPGLSGVHLNVEPWPSGNRAMLVFLDDLRNALPKGKILSVAAYPPPTILHRFPDVHWDEAYFKAVAGRVDQLVVMMYDTGLKDEKIYQSLMRSWTQQILTWPTETSVSKPPEVLLGLPAYQDADVDYHHPDVENITNGLWGIHAGLDSFPTLPPSYQGVALYSEWEMSDSEWQYWEGHFMKSLTSVTPQG